jgi:glutamine cyclotransferase
MQDGWGLTSGKDHIIGSDGTANIYFMDPSTFKGKSHLELTTKPLNLKLHFLLECSTTCIVLRSCVLDFHRDKEGSSQ